MYREMMSGYRFKYELLRALVMELVLEAHKLELPSAILRTSASAAERIGEIFIELLERQFPVSLQTPLTLRSPSSFAACLNIHVNHLNASLKSMTGKSTSAHISERIYQEAKRLLKDNSMRVSEVSICLGFKETQRFSKFFKSFENLTPSDYRFARFN